MAEHFLDNAKIGPISQKMRRKTVAEKMGINIRFQAGEAGAFLYDLPETRRREARPARREKNLATAVSFYQLGTFGRDVGRDGVTRLSSHWDEAHFVSFPCHTQDSLFKIE